MSGDPALGLAIQGGKLARKDVITNYPLYGTSGCDMSASQTSNYVNVQNFDNVGVIITWAGATSPVGIVTFEVSNDYDPVLRVAGTWIALDFGSSISVSGASGDHEISMTNLPFTWMRSKYTRTSGSGTAYFYLSTKQAGG